MLPSRISRAYDKLKNDIEHYAQEHPQLVAEWQPPPRLDQYIRSGAGTFLEIGAGDGVKLLALSAEGALSGYARIIASDLSALRLRSMSARVSVAEAVLADAQALPFDDASINFVFSDQVIEHVADDDKMACEVARVLRPGGKAYVGSVLKLPGAWYFYRNGGQWRVDPTHVREYENEEQYGSLFERAGLIVTSIERTPMVFPLTDLAIKAFVLTRIMRRSRAADAYVNHPWLARLRQKLRVSIPRYYVIGAYLRKPINEHDGI